MNETVATAGNNGVSTESTGAQSVNVSSTPPSNGGWIDKITDPGIRDFATNKGYTKAASAEEALSQSLHSYQSLEKLVGAEKAGRTVVMPNWDATDEAGIAEKNLFLERIGRPKTAEDYAPSLKTGGVTDVDFVNGMSGVMHKAGIPLNMATELTKGYQELQASRDAAATIAKQTQFAQEKTALETEWGAKYNDNMKLASNAARALGIKPEVLDTLQQFAGYGDVMRMFNTIAGKIGEAQFIDGSPANMGGQMSPSEAKAALQTLQRDPDFVKAMNDKHHPKRPEYMARKAQLAAWEVGVNK